MNPGMRIPLVALCALLAATRAPAELLENAGFETGDLSGWTTFGLGWRIGSGDDAAGGSHGMVCDVRHEHEGETWRGIIQNVPVVPGRTYSAAVDIRAVNVHSSSAWFGVGVSP